MQQSHEVRRHPNRALAQLLVTRLQSSIEVSENMLSFVALRGQALSQPFLHPRFRPYSRALKEQCWLDEKYSKLGRARSSFDAGN